MIERENTKIIKVPSAPIDPHALRPGSRAKIQGSNVRDAFAGQTCRVLVLHESGQCEVVIKLMGRDVRTVLPQAALRVIA